MENKKKSGSAFLVQGSILAAASMISRAIGLLYRIPLQNIIGDEGQNYYGTAYRIYNILLIISSYSLPLAVSKLVSANMTQGRRRNVYRILKCALVFATISGGGAALLLFFFAEPITETIMLTPLAIFSVETLVPVLFIVAILGVLRGFFQGLGTMMPSAVSQIIEQIVHAVVSIWAAYLLVSYGARVGAVLGHPDDYAAAYGAAGGTLGTGAGALVALLFAFFVLAAYMRPFKKKMEREPRGREDSYPYIMGMLVVTIVPVLLSTTLYNCNAIIDDAVFKHLAFYQGYSDSEYGVWSGIYTGKYQILINIPISIAGALAASSVPALSAAYAGKNRREARREIRSATRFVMVIAFPCAVGLFVLASPIMRLLFADSSETAANILKVGAAAVVVYSLSTLSNGLLQGIGRMKEPIKNALISLALHLVVLVALQMAFDLNIYAVVVANISFGLIMSILNARSIRRYTGYRQEIPRTFLIPAISAAGMGVAVWAAYRLISGLLGAAGYASAANAVATIVSIIIGVAAYGALLLLLKGLTEEEILRFPKGRVLVRIAKRFHLL